MGVGEGDWLCVRLPKACIMHHGRRFTWKHRENGDGRGGVRWRLESGSRKQITGELNGYKIV